MDWDNPWIALPKVWIRALRGKSMDCPALARSTDCATRLSAHVSSRVRLKVIMVDRKAFEEYITNSFEKKKGSKVISREKGKEIAAYLSAAGKDHKVTVKADPHFKFWVKSRGFRLLDYPALGLKNVLCLPAKKTVWSLDCTPLMCLGCFTRAPVQDKNDTTLLGRFRRVAYIEDFYEILSRIRSVERCHMGYKKTLAEVM